MIRLTDWLTDWLTLDLWDGKGPFQKAHGGYWVSDGIDDDVGEQAGGEVNENVDINVDNDENVDEMLMMMMFPAAACIAVMRWARRAIVGKTQFATRR